MAVVVVGGHTRNIGKTTLAAAVIRAMPERRWTAMKITQFGHGVCSANGEPCDCDTGEHTVAVSEERRTDTGTDTSRMLAAGAARVLWVRTRQGQLADAMARVRREIADAADCVIESNSILRFLKPALYLTVLDPAIADFKSSALRYLDRADAIFLTVNQAGAESEARLREAVWGQVSPLLLRDKPVFALDAGGGLSEDALRFVETRLPVIEAVNPVQ